MVIYDHVIEEFGACYKQLLMNDCDFSTLEKHHLCCMCFNGGNQFTF